jgi:hypothetical protein
VFHRIAILTVFVVLSASHSAAFATDANGLFWYFQRTGYTTATSSQTALAMGDSKSWPVVFSLANGSAQAYALTPVRNFSTNTYWNQIGTDILTGTGTLSAKSSSDGRVGVSIANSFSSYYYGYSGTAGSAIVGRRSTGFTSQIPNVQGITFDQAGAVVTASVDTLAGSGINQFSLPTVQSIATSPFGSIGVLTSSSGLLSYYEKSPLTGWSAETIRSGTIVGGDLAIDTIGRPFVAYSGLISSGSGVHASHFDVMSGQWKTSTFALPSGMYPTNPTIAADGIGGIGMAWMATTSSGSSSLMYAYKNGVKDWALHTVTSFMVASGTSSSMLLPQQRVGLDFDANDWPVISFLANSSGGYGSTADIWIAYDPIVVPEPSAIVLAAAGFAGMCYAARRKRGR